jgi:hypothetical protein
MTKENILRTFLEDSIFQERKHLSTEQITKIKLIEDSNDKLVEVIKIAISGSVDGESESAVSRRINQFLNR